jgi:nucleoside-diphosphate-sugar epimerase
VTGGLLVTGGSGFVGGAVVRALRGSRVGPPVRLLVHDRPVADADRSEFESVRADLAAPSSLDGLCDGIGTVLHLAGYVGPDAARCESVNAVGTEALVAAARRAGCRRFVSLSSAAVYGYGVHDGASEDEVEVAPVTAVSRSRARAERAVLAAGGVVLRPLFIYGPGDTRFLPVVIAALLRWPFLVDGGRARVSVVAVEDLARVALGLARLPDGAWRPGPLHVTDGAPLRFRELVERLHGEFGLPVPRLSLPYSIARLILRAAAARSRKAPGADAGAESATHRLFLVARDHVYDSARVWRLTGLEPGAPFSEQFARCAAWYRRYVPAEAGPARAVNAAGLS